MGNINQLYYNYKISAVESVPTIKEITPSGKIPLDFDLVRNGTFVAKHHKFQWIKSPESFSNDRGTYVIDDKDAFVIKSIADDEYSNVLFNGTFITVNNVQYTVEEISASPDLKYALIITDRKHNWRHSFFSNYFIYDSSSETIVPLIQDLNSRVALLEWSPLSNAISYVLENNVYIYHLESKTTTQVTFDGGVNTFYGKPDWVYEEEVLSSDSALWWSPNGEYLALLRSNDSQVPEFPIPYYVQNDDEDDIQSYAILKTVKYPKAGFPNPVVDLLVYNLQSQTLEKIDKNDVFYNDKDIDNESRLITEVIWVGDHKILSKITNRESDILKIFLINTETMTSVVTRSEYTSDDGGWFEITQDTLYIPKDESKNRTDDGYIDTITVNGYNHLGYFSPPEASEPFILTQGEWEVVDAPSAFDYETNTVYYISTEKSPIERHLYKVDLLDPEAKESVTNVTDEAWYTASFSSGSRFMLLTYAGPKVPYQKLIDLHTGNETIVEDNSYLKSIIGDYDLPKTSYGTVDLLVKGEEPIILNYLETLPLNFDKNKKYPVLFFVYGGPNSQNINKVFSTSFSSIVALELDLVVVTVDGRGTGNMGRKFRSIVHDKLGYYESMDQIAAAKIWAAREYIDEDRVAIWGWSYGGFMTLKTLETDAGEVFKYGMSVAPVTNWKFYDSIYTERYMHTPQNNPEGYKNSSIHKVDRIAKASRFLLMHGTGDDNVHFQNSLKFLDLLNLHGVENYDMMVFPDSDHSISFHDANIVVYDKLLNWIQRAFNGDFE